MRGVQGPLEWVTFPAEEPDLQYRVNVSFLLSNYQCIFGRGCQGLLNRGARPDVACCERGVTFFDEADFERISSRVEQLTSEDCDHIDHIRSRGWYQSSSAGRPYKTRKLGDACIFANRNGGAAGKPGCAFHHLAGRLGIHHSETKPFICWTVPINFTYESADEPGGRTTLIVSAFTADAWGGSDDQEEPTGRGHMGYWCIDTPDAFIGSQPVYKSMERELRAGMSNSGYERMAELLDAMSESRYRMPGQLMNGGQPMIPLLVRQRFPEASL